MAPVQNWFDIRFSDPFDHTWNRNISCFDLVKMQNNVPQIHRRCSNHVSIVNPTWIPAGLAGDHFSIGYSQCLLR